MNTNQLILNLSKEGAKQSFMNPYKIVLIFLAIIMINAILMLVFYDIRMDIMVQIIKTNYIIEIFCMFLISISSLFAISFLSLPDINQQKWIRYIPYIPLMVFLIITMFQSYTINDISLIQALQLDGYNCVRDIILFTITPLVFIFIITSKAKVLYFNEIIILSTLGVGAISYIALRFIHIEDSPMQLIIWHFLPIIFIALAYLLIFKKYFRASNIL